MSGKGRQEGLKGERRKGREEKSCSGFLDLLPETVECIWRAGKARGSPFGVPRRSLAIDASFIEREGATASGFGSLGWCDLILGKPAPPQ